MSIYNINYDNEIDIRANQSNFNKLYVKNLNGEFERVLPGGGGPSVDLPYYLNETDIDFGGVVINPDGIVLGDTDGNETLTAGNIREDRSKVNAIETTVNQHASEIEDLDQMTTSNLNAIQALQDKTGRLRRDTNGDLVVTSANANFNAKFSADGRSFSVTGVENNAATTINSGQITMSSGNVTASITPFNLLQLANLAPMLSVYAGSSVGFTKKVYMNGLTQLAQPVSTTKMLTIDSSTFEVKPTDIPSGGGEVDPYVETLKPRLEVGTDLILKDSTGTVKGSVTSTGIFATETPDLSGSYAMLGNNGSLILATTSGNASLSQANLRKVIDFITNVNAVRNTSTSFNIPVDFTWLNTTTPTTGQKMITINPTTKRLTMSDIPTAPDIPGSSKTWIVNMDAGSSYILLSLGTAVDQVTKTSEVYHTVDPSHWDELIIRSIKFPSNLDTVILDFTNKTLIINQNETSKDVGIFFIQGDTQTTTWDWHYVPSTNDGNNPAYNLSLIPVSFRKNYNSSPVITGRLIRITKTSTTAGVSLKGKIVIKQATGTALEEYGVV